MMNTLIRRGTFAAGVLAALAGLSGPALAQMAVFDAGSYAQRVQEVSQGAQQISNLEQQLQAQRAMLQSLPQSSLGNLLPVVGETSGLINQIHGIQQTSAGLLSNLNQSYPTSFTGQTPMQMQSAIAAMQVQNRQAITSAMQIQDQIAQAQPEISNSITSAENASAGAPGPTAAIQATNQLVGNVASQLTEQNALLSSADRAQQQAALQEQAQVNATNQFMAPTNLPLNGQGVGY